MSLARPSRRRSLLGLGAVLVVAASCAGLGVAQRAPSTGVAVAVAAEPTLNARRPNIVLVMTDDMRADDLRFMPALRRHVTARGLAFRNSFSPYPLCCPARASFLTGQYAHNHRLLSNERPWGFGGFDDRRTLATSLRASGYNTGFVGKYLNNYGQDRSRVTGGPSWRYVPAGWTDWYGMVERPPGVVRQYPSGGTYHYFHPLFNVNGRIDDSHKGRYQTDVLGSMTVKLVRKYSQRDRPFFVWLSALAPHHGAPREPDDRDHVRGSDGRLSDFRTPARPAGVKGAFNRQVPRGAGLPADGSPSERDVTDKPASMRRAVETQSERLAERMLTRQRAESLLVLDRQLTRLVAELRRTGELDNTIVMFTSDNGFFLGEHRLRSGKIRPYEPSLRVPFVLAGPGIPRGVRYDPVRTFDLTATITDLAGAKAPHLADGVSLVPSFSGDLGWTHPVVTEARIPGDIRRRPDQLLSGLRSTIGLRTARYKLVRYASGEVELYDLDVDPNELENVADDPAYERVRLLLDQLWSRYKDCRGADCNLPLPPELQQAPAELAATTLRQAAAVRARYGHTF